MRCHYCRSFKVKNIGEFGEDFRCQDLECMKEFNLNDVRDIRNKNTEEFLRKKGYNKHNPNNYHRDILVLKPGDGKVWNDFIISSENFKNQLGDSIMSFGKTVYPKISIPRIFMDKLISLSNDKPEVFISEDNIIRVLIKTFLDSCEEENGEIKIIDIDDFKDKNGCKVNGNNLNKNC